MLRCSCVALIRTVNGHRYPFERHPARNNKDTVGDFEQLFFTGNNDHTSLFCGHAPDDGVDASLCTNVDALRGLLKKQELRVLSNDSRQQDLLSVPARERLDGPVKVTPRIHLSENVPRGLRRLVMDHEGIIPKAVQDRQGSVRETGHQRYDSVLFPLLRQPGRSPKLLRVWSLQTPPSGPS